MKIKINGPVAKLGLGLIALSAAFAASADTLDDLRKKGYATVAVANEPPYSDIKADGYVTGAAPDVARAVMAKLGVPEIDANYLWCYDTCFASTPSRYGHIRALY